MTTSAASRAGERECRLAAGLWPAGEAASAGAAAILGLDRIGPDDRWRVGNKAWRLARLARAGLPVPAAFCIAADAFGDDDALPHALLAAIRSCRASRPEGDDDAGPAPLAVLVQRQVEAEAAGVLFTADPLSGCRDRLVVNVLHGLGEPLAAGRASGDTFHLSPAGDLLGQTVRAKETMLTSAGEQPVPPGRRRRPTLTPPELRRLAGLASAVGRHFVGAAGDADAAAGGRSRPGAVGQAAARSAGEGHDAHRPATSHGIDIEFAFVRGRPILLQARPIPSRLVAQSQPAADAAALQDYVNDELQKFATNAAALRASGVIRGSDIVWSAGNVRELLPTPSRFSFALFCHIFAGRHGAIVAGRRRLGYRLDAAAGEHLFALIGGQPYFNLEIDAATYDAGLALPIEKLLSEVGRQPERANYPELGLYPDTVATLPGGAAAAADFRRRMLGQARAQRRRFAALLRRLDAVNAAGAAGAGGTGAAPRTGIAALQDAIADELRQLRQLGVRFVIAARFGFYFADLARRRLLALSSDQAAGLRRYARLLQGLPGSKITEQTHDLEDLAAGRLDRAAFLARHGHWARNELELSLPRLAENPDSLDAMLAELAAGGRSPQAQFARQLALRRRCEKALRRHLATRPDEAAELFADLAAAQHYLPLRESLKYHLAIHYGRLRQRLLAMAQQLDWPADSLFQLETQEILDLPADAEGRAATLALSQKRREERTQARRLAQQRPLPPVLFASRPEAIGATPDRAAGDAIGLSAGAASGKSGPRGAAADAGAPAVGAARTSAERSGDDRAEFAAEPIAPGFAEGFVRIIRLDDESAGGRVRLGACAGHEILVAPSANLGLAPLFRSAAGVIVEVGGVLAHCACQAREAGIPALVLADATRRLRDGDRVAIDAQRGRVVVLARAESRPQEW